MTPTCLYCDEIILVDTEPTVNDGSLHYECGLRMIVGSAAHQLHECTCYGGTREDPPDMTRREAAKLAAETFLVLNRKDGSLR